MQLIKRNGVRLAYEEMNSAAPPIILVHGWSCDHTVFARQAKVLSQSHHVVLVDLRGHGMSDAPHQDYTMAAFADDLAWLCTEFALVKPIVVGHSMGGNVALELAARRPELLSSIVLIDSDCLSPPIIPAMHCDRCFKHSEDPTMLQCVGKQCCRHASPQTMKHRKGCSSLPCRRLRNMF